MAETHDIKLTGCAPEPLMAYLKALGVFRLVAEQKDATVRARWQDDVFTLRTKLSRDDLVHFLLEEYRPTPVVAPWNGGSGFYPKDNKQAMNAILESKHERFAEWQRIIRDVQRIVDQMPDERSSAKEWVLTNVRNALPDAALDWLDAAYVLTDRKPRYPPLLGTGGNDGRLDFSNNFMQNVVTALGLDRQVGGKRRIRRSPQPEPQDLVREALFGDTDATLIGGRSTGQFNPGGIGGPNATVGFTTDSLGNPWDFVLMIEGALCFAGAAARRLTAQSHIRAAFPFTVETSAAGYGTAVESEYGTASRAEFWAPLWDRYASLNEVSHLIAEGRAQLGKSQATNGAEFARSVVGLGVERGVREFQRFGFFERNGRAYIATPLGRFKVREDSQASRRAEVLFDLDGWLDRLRRAASGQNAPEALVRHLRAIDRSIIEFCQRGDARRLQEVLIALGRAERWLGTSTTDRVRPLSGLSLQWLEYANDQTPEFRLAAALASIQPNIGKQGVLGPIRAHMEPVTRSFRPDWDRNSTSFVWRSADPLEAMTSVLERRSMESQREGLSHVPLYGRTPAVLEDVVAFLNGNVNYARMADLAVPLACIDWTSGTGPVPVGVESASPQMRLPAAYAAMKLLFLPEAFDCEPYGTNKPIRYEPSLVALLRAGRAGDAYEVARRRLWASDLTPLAIDAGVPSGMASRLAAALLFPISAGHGVRTLARNSLRDRQLV